jgi:hypothetical protein
MKAHVDQVTTAETKWILNVIEHNMPLNSCEGIGNLFNKMFPGVVIDDFSCSADKATYIAKFGWAPYFQDQLVRDIVKSGNGFALQFDETTTEQTKKQLDITIRYWSEKAGCVVIRYLDSKFVGHAEADKVSNALIETVTENGIAVSNVVFISSDGPNVNKAVIQKTNKQLTDSNWPCLVDFGQCNQWKKCPVSQ